MLGLQVRKKLHTRIASFFLQFKQSAEFSAVRNKWYVYVLEGICCTRVIYIDSGQGREFRSSFLHTGQSVDGGCW